MSTGTVHGSEEAWKRQELATEPKSPAHFKRLEISLATARKQLSEQAELLSDAQQRVELLVGAQRRLQLAMGEASMNGVNAGACIPDELLHCASRSRLACSCRLPPSLQV